jgi:hypothetical protein
MPPRLSREQHVRLLEWACACVEHVLAQLDLGDQIDPRISEALRVGRAWAQNEASLPEAQAAALAAHTVARASSDPSMQAIARAAGHAAACAQMAEHASHAASFAIKALSGVQSGSNLVLAERQWQREQLPRELHAIGLKVIRNPQAY